jgi:hypothetical protein
MSFAGVQTARRKKNSNNSGEQNERMFLEGCKGMLGKEVSPSYNNLRAWGSF